MRIFRNVLPGIVVHRLVLGKLRERVVKWLNRSDGDTDRRDDASRQDDRTESNLFYCAACDSTYVSVEMEACSSCGDELEQVPTERELSRFPHQ